MTLCSLFIAAPAAAHIELQTPAARHSQQKKGPCGVDEGADMKGEPVATYAGGETITLVWDEFVNHPAHYRISLDLDGQDDFVDPSTMNEYYSNEAVLLDEIPDMAGGIYSVEVTLPDVSCDTCTLQVIQVMYDKPPYGDGNDLYYQCADIVIEGGVGTSTGSTTGDPTTGTGDPTTGDPTTGDPTTGDPTTDPTTGDPTTDPTTGDPTQGGSSSGSATESASATAGPTAGSGDSDSNSSTGTVTATGGAMNEDEGCGCVQGDSDGAPWAALGILAIAVRRRRRC